MKRIGVSELRQFNTKKLRELKESLEICVHNQPLRVLVPYDIYMQMQAFWNGEPYLSEPQLPSEEKKS